MLKANKFWAVLALAWLLSCGCSGILVEKKGEDGTVQRIKVDGGEIWSGYDDKPRNPNTKKSEDIGIMLKQEATF